MQSRGTRVPVLYLAPWVDIGGADTSTIDWFRCLDRRRFSPSLITTQPSQNRRLAEIAPFAEELWELPQLLRGEDFPGFIQAFIHTRGVRVVHIMNARLGFDLLPDITTLPRPPRIVVQLHGEEPDRRGYVRYVAVRYGNLVDAFSMTTRTLDQPLAEYEIPSSKRRFIPLGVDSEIEFAPEGVEPIGARNGLPFQILFPARLTAQKNPLLMVDVATELRSRGFSFQIHVLGDGDLTRATMDRVAEAGLRDIVVLHGAQTKVAPRYAASDVVLLTSAFETSPPRAAYEAMAMGLPIIAPKLPQIEELVSSLTGALVDPERGAVAYADAICSLAGDEPRRRAMGEAAHSRARAQYSVQRMAAEHAALYEELLARPSLKPRIAAPPPEAASSPQHQTFRRPRREPRASVSVIVACFNHGHYLGGCLQSVRAQSYEPIETIIVDDGSDDPETLRVLGEIERDGWTVLRRPVNAGPSSARNAGIEQARGRYLLPLDADDMLFEDAVAALVTQLSEAPDHIGYVYPNLQFFGNRSDYWEPPSFNLYGLLSSNFCAISSLLDREIFDRGLRYPEDIGLGQEDWDFVLTLAEQGIYGEPARSKTLLVRKQGFGRNALVGAAVPFAEIVAKRHPRLFGNRDAIKKKWNPALSLVALGPESASAQARLESLATAQSCQDFEIIRSDTEKSTAQRLSEAHRDARSRYLMATYVSLERLLEDRAFVEKMLRVLGANHRVTALGFADGGIGKLPFQRLEAGAAVDADPSALCWATHGVEAPPTPFPLAPDRPLEALARWLTINGKVQWRHLDEPGFVERCNAPDPPHAVLEAPSYRRPVDAQFKTASVRLPDSPGGVWRGGTQEALWRPPETRLLCRHRHIRSESFVYTNDLAPPDEHRFDHLLGCVREFPLAGSKSLTCRPARAGFGLGETHDPGDPTLLGFVEEQPLPLLDALLRGRHRRTGQPLLAAGEDDPLLSELEAPVVLGWIEPQPLRPRLTPEAGVPRGLIGLLRSVDLGTRRHRYGAGKLPPGLPGGELGALMTEPIGESRALWLSAEGEVVTDDGPLPNGRPRLRTALRWTADPLSWEDPGPVAPRVRAVARRALDSTAMLITRNKSNGHSPQLGGYLLRSATPKTLPLYAAVHPVTGDHLLSTSATEGPNLGYDPIGILGHLAAAAPVTGELGIRRPGTPWAKGFGLAALERKT